MHLPGKRARQVAALSFAVVCASPLAAQRVHVPNFPPFPDGLIGELPPDTSNWPHPAAPDGNRFPRSTDPPAVIKQAAIVSQLGKILFWDEQVSSNNTMACGTCHLPSAGGTDDRLGAVFNKPGDPNNGNFGAFGVVRQSVNGITGAIDYGFQLAPSTDINRLVTPVTPPTMIGAYLFNKLFWDMRAGKEFHDDTGAIIPNFTDWAALEDLAVGPPVSDVEMGHESIKWPSGFLQNKIGTSFPLALVNPLTIPADIAPMVGSGLRYDALFDKVFQTHPQFGGVGVGVTRERFALALANYHRTLIPDRAPIDRGTMTRQQHRGFNFLKTNASCFLCHSASGNPTIGPLGVLVDPFDNLFSDGRFHQINVTPTSPARKTPTLRNIGLHKKFFSTGHGGDGILKIFVTNFDDLVTFYDDQPGFFGINGTGPGGTMTLAERAAVKDFLQNALTDPRVAAETFPFDRPQLRSEAAPFEGNEYGTGTAGPSGLIGEIIANVPEKVVQPTASQWFKIGVGNAPINRPAFLLVGGFIGAGPVLWVASPFTVIPAQPTNAQGISTIHLPFPLTAPAIGVPVFTQWMFDDFGVRAFSDAAKFVPY